MTWLIIVSLVVLGIYDWIRYRSGRETISQWYHKQFPQYVDSIILITVAAGIWWIFGPPVFAVWITGVVAGHIFWHGD